MRELHQAIPDPDALLALEPEELGAALLFILRQRVERDGRPVSPYNCVLEAMTEGDPSRGQIGYPRDRREAVGTAVSEAFAWLEAQALLVPQPGAGSPGWFVLSRRARRFESRAEFMSYAGARRLPRELLHPQLREEVWLSFVRGELAEAVFKTGAIRKVFAENPSEFDPRKYLVPAMAAMKKLCIERFEAFGAAGQADGIRPIPLREMARRYASGSLSHEVA